MNRNLKGLSMLNFVNIYYFAGATLGFLLFSHLLRETFLAKNKSPYALAHAGLLVAISGSFFSGIGGADGGSFNFQMFYTSVIIYSILVLMSYLYAYINRNRFEFIPQSRLESYIYWTIIIILFIGFALVNWLIFSNGEVFS